MNALTLDGHDTTFRGISLAAIVLFGLSHVCNPDVKTKGIDEIESIFFWPASNNFWQVILFALPEETDRFELVPQFEFSLA